MPHFTFSGSPDGQRVEKEPLDRRRLSPFHLRDEPQTKSYAPSTPWRIKTCFGWMDPSETSWGLVTGRLRLSWSFTVPTIFILVSQQGCSSDQSHYSNQHFNGCTWRESYDIMKWWLKDDDISIHPAVPPGCASSHLAPAVQGFP